MRLYTPCNYYKLTCKDYGLKFALEFFSTSPVYLRNQAIFCVQEINFQFGSTDGSGGGGGGAFRAKAPI